MTDFLIIAFWLLVIVFCWPIAGLLLAIGDCLAYSLTKALEKREARK